MPAGGAVYSGGTVSTAPAVVEAEVTKGRLHSLMSAHKNEVRINSQI